MNTQTPRRARHRSLRRGAALLLAAAAGTAADSPASLRLRAAMPAADAAVTAPLLRLDMAQTDLLAFEMLAEFDCGAAAEPERLFVAIADTVSILPASALVSPQSVRIQVPRRQLRHVTAASACPAPLSGRTPPTAYLLRDAAASQGTLVCRRADGGVEAHRAAAALGVLVECVPEAGPGLVDDAAPAPQSALPE